MSFKWQNDHMELFLKTYKKHECLWNNKSPDYSKPNAREIAYNSMLNELNIPGLSLVDVKSKIKTIRTRYASELAKITRSKEKILKGDSNATYKPKLFWFKIADAFLRQVVYSSKKNVEEQASILENYESENSEDMKNLMHLEMNMNEHESDKFLSVKFNTSNRSPSPAKNSTIVANCFSEQTDNILDRNEFDIFCESLAYQLKRMPLERALICQRNLQNVMTNERLFQIGSYNGCRPEQRSQHSGITSPSTVTPPSPNRNGSSQSENQHNCQTSENDVTKLFVPIKMET